LGAFFAVEPQKTGLSACIFCPGNRAKGYRFYPLRESKPQSGFDFAEFCFAKLQETFLRFTVLIFRKAPQRGSHSGAGIACLSGEP
jgi:hypothetical protein